MSALGWFVNKALNLSQASNNGSLVPCKNVAMSTFTLVFLDGKKKQAKNLVSIHFKLVRLWLGCD